MIDQKEYRREWKRKNLKQVRLMEKLRMGNSSGSVKESPENIAARS